MGIYREIICKLKMMGNQPFQLPKEDNPNTTFKIVDGHLGQIKHHSDNKLA